jgi:hypothetical protein
MNIPLNVVSGFGIRATAGDSILIATTTNELYLYQSILSSNKEALQIISCRTNNTSYKLIDQKIGSTTQQKDLAIKLPTNTVCYLRTFDSNIASAQLIYATGTPIFPQSNTYIYSSSTGSTTPYIGNYISSDKQVDIYFFSIILFLILVYFWRDIFKVDRYD